MEQGSNAAYRAGHVINDDRRGCASVVHRGQAVVPLLPRGEF